MKIKDYPKITELKTEDSFVVETENGTRRVDANVIKVAGLPEKYTIVPFEEDVVILHNSHFRGKNLGTEVTEEQINSVRNGTFDDIWVGDYWEISNMKWRVVGLNHFIMPDEKRPSSFPYLGTLQNHIVLFPDTYITKYQVIPGNDGATYSDSFSALYFKYLNDNKYSLVPNSISKYFCSVRTHVNYKDLTTSMTTVNDLVPTAEVHPIIAPNAAMFNPSFDTEAHLIIYPGKYKKFYNDVLPLYKIYKKIFPENTKQENLFFPVDVGLENKYAYCVGGDGELGMTGEHTLQIRPLVIIG